MSILIIIMSDTLWGGVILLLVSVPFLITAQKLGIQNYTLEKNAKAIQRKYNNIAHILMDRTFANERKLFGYSKKLQQRYNDLNDESFAMEAKIFTRVFSNLKTGSVVTIVVSGLIIAMLLPSLHNGAMSIGIFIALVNGVINLMQLIGWQLPYIIGDNARTKEYLKDLNLFFSLSSKTDACVIPNKENKFVFQSIEFRNVSFKYPNTENYILYNCSFVMYSNKTYALVGVNGAGKSTIIKLILGMYDEYNGEIFINNKDIKTYDYSMLKSIIAVVFQDFATYQISLKENITLGNNLIYNNGKFEKIVQDVGLTDFIATLKNNSDTHLGKLKQDSIDISGGQWQRIAIGRLLYSNAPINILDEPTAALDPIAESKVYEMFHTLNKDRFTIYITHRLGAAKMSDEILVIHNGKIAESGSHNELMNIKDGIYSVMFNTQKSWY
ncbi:hypothetical protein AN639_00105 [Candidatus Epulonipiscium fishelsonii]|uniref:Uncharacterized protein n=2 Tax=Candidatus Epulonipiscium fishelsonii TaxID=77094 RepID=A0ACC8XF02_9FIRM|nr:hypothetical protein AN396_06030 [Epulopiscium sp. SCG-B11WGA-EpuloA1]ONI41621.1 hypothetical protein AN396_03415 [Epulopiscium sp. SCG-B11WGA-EpuloA1]ONI43960.1 hypothetical protein AN639_00105 [Epulopiscium sp. SCG-B05WGA-EpuloA1]